MAIPPAPDWIEWELRREREGAPERRLLYIRTDVDIHRHGALTSILESKIGYQAVVLTHAPSGARIKVTAREVYIALAKWIPDPADPRKLLANPHAMWTDIDPKLYFRTIQILGPPRDSTIRRLFAELVLEPECDRYASLKALKDADRRKYTEICHTLRADGVYREGEQTATLISQRLWAEPNALVILDYGFYQAHRAELAGTVLGDVEPTLSAFVGKVIAVKNVPAAQLVPLLRPLLPQQAHLVALPCVNVLMIADTFGNVKRIERLIQALDTGEPYTPEKCGVREPA